MINLPKMQQTLSSMSSAIASQTQKGIKWAQANPKAAASIAAATVAATALVYFSSDITSLIFKPAEPLPPLPPEPPREVVQTNFDTSQEFIESLAQQCFVPTVDQPIKDVPPQNIGMNHSNSSLSGAPIDPLNWVHLLPASLKQNSTNSTQNFTSAILEQLASEADKKAGSLLPAFNPECVGNGTFVAPSTSSIPSTPLLNRSTLLALRLNASEVVGTQSLPLNVSNSTEKPVCNDVGVSAIRNTSTEFLKSKPQKEVLKSNLSAKVNFSDLPVCREPVASFSNSVAMVNSAESRGLKGISSYEALELMKYTKQVNDRQKNP